MWRLSRLKICCPSPTIGHLSYRYNALLERFFSPLYDSIATAKEKKNKNITPCTFIDVFFLLSGAFFSFSSRINNDARCCFFSVTRSICFAAAVTVRYESFYSTQSFSSTFRSIIVIIFNNVDTKADQYWWSTRSQNSSGCYQPTTRKSCAIVRDYFLHLFLKFILFF